MTRCLTSVLAILLCLASPTWAQTLLDFSAAEIASLLRHGPWPATFTADPSNRVSGVQAAITLGRALFFDPRLSPDSTLSCASCHHPDHAWSDARRTSQGRVPLTRNAPSLRDVRLQRWFGWDGATDSLWAMSLRPILAPQELGATPDHIASLLRTDPAYAAAYTTAFARLPGSAGPPALARDVAKALAAFQETLTTPPGRFDEFRDALARGDRPAAARYPLAAQRGARLFVGRANCALCHLGPAFTNGEFHDIGIAFFTPSGVDPGRHGGIALLRASKDTLLGPSNDDPVRAPGTATRHVEPQHRNFGEFRVPTLRGVAQTAPYMHNGSLPTLRDVVRHYSELDPDRLHSDGEAILKPLNLSEAEIDDLVAFLETL